MQSDEPTGRGSERILTPDEIEAKLSVYQSRLPSTVIEELLRYLKTMKLSESKVDEIISRVASKYSGEDVSEQIDSLSSKLDTLSATVSRMVAAIEKERSYLEREPTPPTEEVPEAEPKTPFLSSLREDAVTRTLFLKWVEFLLSRVGHERLDEALNFYVDIGWITEEIAMKALAYSKGISTKKGRKSSKLTPEDHLRTLIFLERLGGKKIDENLITKAEREITYLLEKRLRRP
ncbi:MAG: FlaD/FlaE family flagellar protein [Candidatus Micrarchaeia archaeon]